jgi:nitrate reductase gamma subunit
MIATKFRWGVLIGLVGFVGGFACPLIFTQVANEGPLLGRLITRPLGLVVGLMVGLIVALRKRQRRC